ncbi:hypothetical protein XBP1_740014 [Xenorhabdus bovienii str. puntauvense]|uniref:Uncharacterized protein n=2 Tax=Xenorhabdus bovienii TaxID=40576 RepID=A0A077NK07_XENBV|nr:hypothetical protein XBFFR1_2130050 [Xenorhabdus bovienii str. feltiae France]CDG93494.1 hypothetical protein XBFFL1_2550014 [Xenorhabdus bovienii str. feltiae Florida]CDG99139.1 hypothetical protein XBP1_740014 [Xenorhabdus bovienii str. puntauvense]CDH03933.1 hypothetical protein XBFM1_90029 [Xenorhabdus bovienii str. feltiae Moldova]
MSCPARWLYPSTYGKYEGMLGTRIVPETEFIKEKTSFT